MHNVRQSSREIDMSSSPFANEAAIGNISGKNIIVTGGTTGIGRATARVLAAAGARVMICGRHAKEMSEAVADMTGDVRGVIVDLSTLDGVKLLFERADQELGQIDVLVNNAALPIEGTAEVDPETIDTSSARTC